MIAYLIRRIALSIFAASYTLEDCVNILSVFQSFFKGLKESDIEEGFNTFYLTKDAQQKLKSMLTGYPQVYASGEAGMKKIDPLYVLAQFLIVIAMKVEILEEKVKGDSTPEKWKSFREESQKLFKIWGSEAAMNYPHLKRMLAGKTVEEISEALQTKLENSQEILKGIVKDYQK